jgi:hypothetical protein
VFARIGLWGLAINETLVVGTVVYIAKYGDGWTENRKQRAAGATCKQAVLQNNIDWREGKTAGSEMLIATGGLTGFGRSGHRTVRQDGGLEGTRVF